MDADASLLISYDSLVFPPLPEGPAGGGGMMTSAPPEIRVGNVRIASTLNAMHLERRMQQFMEEREAAGRRLMVAAANNSNCF